jgi:predicted  nucleic acid-binding Zn-ribbon protein
MKTFWSTLAKILFVLVLIQAWFLYDFYQNNQALIADNIQLEQKLLAANDSLENLNTSLDMANKKIETLEKNSFDNVLKDTNKAVINSWEALLNTVEGELEKARKSIDSTIDEIRKELPADESEFNTDKKQTPPPIVKGERT